MYSIYLLLVIELYFPMNSIAPDNRRLRIEYSYIELNKASDKMGVPCISFCLSQLADTPVSTLVRTRA
jgi:hypothetical protein